MQENSTSPAPEQIWDGTLPPAQKIAKGSEAALRFSGGDGTEGNPWEISSAADFAQLAADVAAGTTYDAEDEEGDPVLERFFILTQSLYLNANPINPALVNPDPEYQGPAGYDNGQTVVNEWTPVGGAGAGPVPDYPLRSYGFGGDFDGQNFTIYNAFYNRSDPNIGRGVYPENQVGIFGDLHEDGVLKNLNTAGGYMGGNVSVGGIVGRNWGGTVTNCHNGNFVYATGSQGTGGVVGANWIYVPDEDDLRTAIVAVVDSCSNSATVVGDYMKPATETEPAKRSGSSGGVVGENECNVINSWNTGLVSALLNAGGVIGSNQNESSNQQVTIETPGKVYNCYNTANIGVTTAQGSGIPAVTADCAGGIIGYQTGSCENVYNIGNITVNPGVYAPEPDPVGQIIGLMKVRTGAGATQQTNDYFNSFTGASPSAPVGYVKSGTVGSNLYTFTAAPAQKGSLRDRLNNWVNSHSGQGYENWKIVNNGYPVLDI
jgi:hypothetical protein